MQWLQTVSKHSLQTGLHNTLWYVYIYLIIIIHVIEQQRYISISYTTPWRDLAGIHALLANKSASYTTHWSKY